MSTTPHSGSDREIQQELERAKSEASQLASSAAQAAKQRGQEAADRMKDTAAERADEFASALESTAEDLETSDGGEMIAGYGRSLAELMRRFAGGLRESEIEEFAGQLATFARRNPASFLAGSVALGFGMSRFLKATSTRSLESYGYDDDEYLLDEEDEFEVELDDADDTMSSEPRYASGESESASGTDTWPEDRGRERPGSASPTDHWSPSISDDASEETRRNEP